MSSGPSKIKRPGQVTIAQVARASGVATSTASHILNQRPGFSATPETRKRVQDAAASLGYRPNLAARVLRGASTKTIGLITPSLIYEATAAKCVAFEALARAAGYLTMITVTPDDAEAQDRLILALTDRQVDGIALYVTHQGPHTQLKALIESGFPVVTFGAHELGLGTDDISLDYYQGGTLQAQHILELGRKKVWFISRTEDGRLFPSVEARQAGLRDTLAKAGIPLRERYWPLHPDMSPSTLRQYDRQVLEFLRERHQEVDTIVASNDDIAMSVVQAARELRLSMPEDLAVLGYDNARVSRSMLTSIGHDSERFAQIGFEFLMDRVSGARPSPRHRVVEASLIIRDSTVKQQP